MKVYILSNNNKAIHSCYSSKVKALKAVRKYNRIYKKVKKFETDFEELEVFLEWGDENKTLDYHNTIIKPVSQGGLHDTRSVILALLDVDKDVLVYDFQYCQEHNLVCEDIRTFYELQIIEKDLL